MLSTLLNYKVEEQIKELFINFMLKQFGVVLEDFTNQVRLTEVKLKV